MKRICLLILSAALLFSLTACGHADGQAASTPPTRQPETPPAVQPSVEAEPSAPTENGKILVAYYSATGSTGAVANTIAEALGADLFVITPVEPYSSADLNWTDQDSRVSREHEDPSLQDVELTVSTPESWAAYDTVFVG